MAGFFYTLTCGAILVTCGSIYITGFMSELILGGSRGTFLLLLTWGTSVVFWSMVYVGYRVRTTSKRV